MKSNPVTSPPTRPSELVDLAREAGADDAACVPVDAPSLGEEAEHIRALLPEAKSVISIVVAMNREQLNAPARSLANLEFHHAGEEINAICRRLALVLCKRGHRALAPAMGFPMEVQHFPDRIWSVAHKTVAVAAGMGHMGLHRSVIHPKLGSSILLGTVVTDIELDPDGVGVPLEGNPCFQCKLCVPACPVGAISPDGAFHFTACLTHNYRDFMGGFADWAEGLASSRSALAFRRKSPTHEQVSIWQSLSFGANYKAAYCMAVCPAGEDVISPFLGDKRGWRDRYLRPIEQRVEPVYVLPGSDAEAHVAKRYPHKPLRRVSSHLHPRSIGGFLDGLDLAFQPGQSRGIDARFHFRFTGCTGTDGTETIDATVEIRDGALVVQRGHLGDPDLAVTADARTWLAFLAKEVSILRALLTRKVRPRGRLSLLPAFGRCFPL
ncbi:MAG TPA: 4Fe-4S ferredoxin [Planctomycetes bacterium]|nr:4Fe-4S ferredoxin [Planctomycetota bacterium]